MYIALAVVHLVVTIGLILIVLLQSGKGADIGAVFGGGSSQTVFGGRGAATFQSKLTSALAILFMVTSLGLTILASQQGTQTVIPEEAPQSTQTPPAAPAAPAAPATPPAGAPSAPSAPSK